MFCNGTPLLFAQPIEYGPRAIDIVRRRGDGGGTSHGCSKTDAETARARVGIDSVRAERRGCERSLGFAPELSNNRPLTHRALTRRGNDAIMFYKPSYRVRPEPGFRDDERVSVVSLCGPRIELDVST